MNNTIFEGPLVSRSLSPTPSLYRERFIDATPPELGSLLPPPSLLFSSFVFLTSYNNKQYACIEIRVYVPLFIYGQIEITTRHE